MSEKVVIGDATLYCGDCREILPELSGIDAMVTDPPYSSGGMTRGDRVQSTRDKYQSTNAQVEHLNFTGDNRDQRSFLAWVSLWLTEAQRAMNPGAIVALFSDWRQMPTMTDALQAGGFVWRGIVPWDKVNARPQPDRFRSQCEYVVWGTNGPREFSMTSHADYLPGIVTCAAPTGIERVHSTQKPVDVMTVLCRAARKGGLVFDPFMGSGTTGVAAVTSERRFIGVEAVRAYFDIACERIDRAQQQKRLFA